MTDQTGKILVEFDGIEAFIDINIINNVDENDEPIIKQWFGNGVIVEGENKIEMKHYKIYNVGETIVTKIWIDTSNSLTNVIPMMKFEFEGNGRINLN
jgi:hypothetical protein